MPQELLEETEEILEKWKHPDPYYPPTAPGGENADTQYQSFHAEVFRFQI